LVSEANILPKKVKTKFVDKSVKIKVTFGRGCARDLNRFSTGILKIQRKKL
jgi:hypothetical protein